MLIDLLAGKWNFETPYLNSYMIIEKIDSNTLNIVEQRRYGGRVPSIVNGRLITLKPFFYTYQYPLFRFLQVTQDSAKISSHNSTYAFTPILFTLLSDSKLRIGDKLYTRV